MIPITLENKTALITGGGQGLGAETALLLHRAGAKVAINYFEEGSGANKYRAEALAGELRQGAMTFEGDVRNAKSAAKAANAVADFFGGVDILVNNAGILRDRSFAKMSEEEWRAVIDTNLTGVFQEHPRRGAHRDAKASAAGEIWGIAGHRKRRAVPGQPPVFLYHRTNPPGQRRLDRLICPHAPASVRRTKPCCLSETAPRSSPAASSARATPWPSLRRWNGCFLPGVIANPQSVACVSAAAF